MHKYLLSKIQYLELSFVIHYQSVWKLKMRIRRKKSFSKTLIAGARKNVELCFAVDLCLSLSLKEFFFWFLRWSFIGIVEVLNFYLLKTWWKFHCQDYWGFCWFFKWKACYSEPTKNVTYNVAEIFKNSF